MNCISFADDMALMAPSRSALQKMIDICTEYCDTFCLNFNAKKSGVMIFGKQSNSPEPVSIKGENIDIVSELKYLGTTLVSGDCLNFTARYDIVNFFRATNAITSVLNEAHEHTMLYLIYSNCVPILTYASNVKLLSSDEMLQCNKALNDALRKVFGFRDWRSIRVLREIFKFKSITDIFCKNQRRFHENCISHLNPVVTALSKIEIDEQKVE